MFQLVAIGGLLLIIIIIGGIVLKQSFVYIMFNQRNGTLYVGVTSNLPRRVYEHKKGIGSKFTKKYSVDKLGYYEIFSDVLVAIEYEKKLKAGSRQAKIALIEEKNPHWQDLYEDILPK